jgi:hypothetical protein
MSEIVDSSNEETDKNYMLINRERLQVKVFEYKVLQYH